MAEETKFYDWNGLPASVCGVDIYVFTVGGGKRRVHELTKFAHEASPVSEKRFNELKKAL